MSRPLATQPLPVPRWPRRMAYGAAGLAVLLPSSTAGAGWYFASQLLTPSRLPEYAVTVRAIDGDRVTLTRTEDTERPIALGLIWPHGHARLGEIVSMDKTTVVRRVSTLTRGVIRAGIRADAGSSVFDGDPFTAHGLEFADVLAWLATLANIAGIDLEAAIRAKYGAGCPGCGRTPCMCDRAEKP